MSEVNATTPETDIGALMALASEIKIIEGRDDSDETVETVFINEASPDHVVTVQ